MRRLKSWAATVVGWLCLSNYSFATDAVAAERVTELKRWAASLRQRLDFYGHPGPPELAGREPQTALDFAWLLAWAAQEVTLSGTPPEKVDQLWGALTITPSHRQRLGLATMRVLTMGTDCRCCHGYRVLVLVALAGFAGWLAG